MRGTLSFSQGIESDDGDVGTRTGLGFGIASATRVETFSLNFGTEIFGDFSSDANDTFDATNQSAALRYSRAGGNSRLSFSALYDDVELDDETIEGVGDTVLISTGFAESIAADLELEFGVEGPVGILLNFGRREVDYSETTDPDLLDFETTSADVLANFRIRPSFTIRARAGIEREDEEEILGTSRTEDFYFGIGAETETASGMTVTADILFDSSEVTPAVGGATEEDGVGIELSVTQERTNGFIGVAVSSRIDEAGRRTSAEVSRGFDLREGAMELSLGVVDQEGDDNLRLIGGVSFERETRRGALTASVSQEAATSSGDAVISTVVDLGISQEIDNVSGWTAGIGFAASDELGGEYDSRSTATIAYTRDLTADWEMNTGVEYSKDRDESSTNTVFFNIARDFTFGF
ncbi:MAG: hypothetical protein HKN27_18135 [Silicimonas sp.]|nr:hypothetical protein [Silicimonas sp.]